MQRDCTPGVVRLSFGLLKGHSRGVMKQNRVITLRGRSLKLNPKGTSLNPGRPRGLPEPSQPMMENYMSYCQYGCQGTLSKNLRFRGIYAPASTTLPPPSPPTPMISPPHAPLWPVVWVMFCGLKFKVRFREGPPPGPMACGLGLVLWLKERLKESLLYL